MGLTTQAYHWIDGNDNNFLSSKYPIRWINNTGSTRKIISISAKMASVDTRSSTVTKNNVGVCIENATGAYAYGTGNPYKVQLGARIFLGDVFTGTEYMSENEPEISERVGVHPWSQDGKSGVTANYTNISSITTWTFKTFEVRSGYTVKFYFKVTKKSDSLVITLDFTNIDDAAIMPPVCTLTYDATGGTGAPVDQSAAKGSFVTISSQIPSKTNYNFKNWSLNSTGTSSSYTPGQSIQLDDNKTLYAIWEDAKLDLTLEQYRVEKTTRTTDPWDLCAIIKASSTATDWSYRYNDETNYRLYSSANTSSITYRIPQTAGKIYRIYFRARRVNSTVTGETSDYAEYDLVLPKINRASVNVTGAKQGDLTFIADKKVQWEFTGTLNGATIRTVNAIDADVPANTEVTRSVNLWSNSSLDYTLRVKRSDNIFLTDSKQIPVSTVPLELNLSIDSGYPLATVVKLTCKAPSNVQADTWNYDLWKITKENNITTTVRLETNTAISGGTNAEVKLTRSSLIPGILYKAKFYATDNRNIIASSNEVTFIPTGGIYVYDETTQKNVLCGVYIYNSTKGKWEIYNPYVYNNNEWKISN